MNLAVVIAAGGIGSRIGAGGSKQMMLLGGRPVLARTAGIYNGHDVVREMVIAIEAGDVERCRAKVVREYGLGKVSRVVAGGGSRAESVRAALEALGAEADVVLVHDGARPLFPIGLLDGALAELAASGADGVVFGMPVTDTIKEVDAAGYISGTPERSRLWAAQTPQIFHRGILERAYGIGRSVGTKHVAGARRESAPSLEMLRQATDDAALVELTGGRVKMVKGSEENIKLTTPADVIMAEEILRRRGLA